MPEDAKEAIGHGIRAKRAIIGSALGASLRAERALSDQLEPQLAANEGRSALKGFDGNVALRLQDAIHLGAAGVHAFGEGRLRHALAPHFLCELLGDYLRHRLSLRGFAETVLAQKRIERRAQWGSLVMPASPSSVYAQSPVSRRLLGLLMKPAYRIVFVTGFSSCLALPGRVVPLIAIPTARLAHGRELGLRHYAQAARWTVTSANFRGSKVQIETAT